MSTSTHNNNNNNNYRAAGGSKLSATYCRSILRSLTMAGQAVLAHLCSSVCDCPLLFLLLLVPLMLLLASCALMAGPARSASVRASVSVFRAFAGSLYAINEGRPHSSDSRRPAAWHLLPFVRLVSTSAVVREVALSARYIASTTYRVSTSYAVLASPTASDCPTGYAATASPSGLSTAADTHAAPHNDRHYCRQPATAALTTATKQRSADRKNSGSRHQPTTRSTPAVTSQLTQHTRNQHHTPEVTALHPPTHNNRLHYCPYLVSSQQNNRESAHQRPAQPPTQSPLTTVAADPDLLSLLQPAPAEQTSLVSSAYAASRHSFRPPTRLSAATARRCQLLGCSLARCLLSHTRHHSCSRLHLCP